MKRVLCASLAAVLIGWAASSAVAADAKPPAKAPPEKIGVGFAPHLTSDDPAENDMFKVVGQFPQVKYMFTPNNPDELFDALIKLKKAGKTVDFIVIAGHGSANNPRIELGNVDLVPESVDLAAMRERLAEADRAAADPGTKDVEEARRTAADLRRRIDKLESVSDTMAPGAGVVLLNCSAAATPEGKAFVKNLGNVLVGKNGGAVVASKSDIKAKTILTWFDTTYASWRNGEVVDFGDIILDGDWVKTAVPTASKFTGVAGEWSSDWGPVTFEGKGASFTGFWQQGEKMRGQIKEGTFDPRTRKVVFSYYQDWNDQHGQAELTLSEDGQTLSGTWKQESGGGDWIMTRKK